uniref:Ferritin n=1 Tax=Astyanax mexicanus TaxID=7994 RepID=A0A3B1JP12_ASTMX
MQSVVKHNLHSESEGAINKLINIKLTASYTYLSLGMYFDRDDVALPNFSKYFLERSVKEREHAERLLGYQNMRGGRVLLQTIAVSVGPGLKSFLLCRIFCAWQLFGRCSNTYFPHCIPNCLCDFLESHFLPDSHETIKKLGDYLSSLTRLTSSEPNGHMGEYLFDKHTL